MHPMFPPMDPYIRTARHIVPRVSRQTVAGAPEALRGRRLVFASDFHLREETSPEPVVEAIQNCKADLILLGGDYADTNAQALRLFDAFRALRAPMGIFAVRGNNDTEAFETPERLAEGLARFGAELLLNRSVDLGGVLVGGVDEARLGHPDYAAVFGDAPGYRILVSHFPILPEAEPADMPDLMLSGHTHGGQFNFLGITPFAVGFERCGGKSRLAPALVSGTRRFGRTQLLVSKGIGTSRIPLRVGVRPEIHLLEFC